MASQASAAPSSDQQPLSERIAGAEAKERAHEAAARRAARRDNQRRGNVIFLHPDGGGPAMWQAGRVYWKGPDKNLFWDRLPHKAMYRGHANDLRLSGTRGLTMSSNGGATTHAFGFKVQAPELLRTRRFAANPGTIGVPRQYRARGGEQGPSGGRGQ